MLTHYDMRLQAKIVSGGDGFGAVFHSTNDDDTSRRIFHIGDEVREVNELLSRDERTHEVTMRTETARRYDVRIEVRDTQCTCYLNDRRLFQGIDENLRRVRVGLFAYGAFRIRIYPDADTLNPLEDWSEMGTIQSLNRRHASRAFSAVFQQFTNC
jgi:hypothetical protein